MKVTMYQANDNSLHKSQKERDARNAELRLAPLAEAFVNNLPLDQISKIEGHPAIALEDLPTFIVKNADALRKTLNEALIVRRKKAAKKQAATPALAPSA